MFSTIIIFIIILAILILAHEAGHFWAAKKTGVRVDEFGFGFPPRIFSKKKGETRYSLNLIPIGGFVKIHGEQGEGKGDKDSFISKSIGQRALILAAGVGMNFILATFLLSIGHVAGLPTSLEGENISGGIIKNQKTQIVEIAKNSPAETIGLKIGDEIKSLASQNEIIEINSSKQVSEFVKKYQNSEILIEIQRGKEIIKINFTPRLNPPENEGPLGVALSDTALVSYPWWKSIYLGVKDVINIIILVSVVLADIIYKAFVGQPVGEVLSGPVGIYSITSQAAGMGWIYLLQLTAFLSIQLGLINIFPFPALDGGRLLFLAIEKIKGSPVSPKVENIIHTAGFAILICLMVIVTWRDLTRLF